MKLFILTGFKFSFSTLICFYIFPMDKRIIIKKREKNLLFIG